MCPNVCPYDCEDGIYLCVDSTRRKKVQSIRRRRKVGAVLGVEVDGRRILCGCGVRGVRGGHCDAIHNGNGWIINVITYDQAVAGLAGWVG